LDKRKRNSKKRKNQAKTRAQSLLELLEDPKAREMIKKTDSFGGHLRSGDKKCTI
jgi:hypothetical protein